MNFHKHYGNTEGPLGLPMQDRQAKQLDALLRALPSEDRQLRRLTSPKAPTELLDGERADVSWISTEDIDRDKEIVIARGMNDAHFKLNPIVTLQHCYHSAPVGRSLWRKRVKDGTTNGIKAKTQYPPRPEDWPADECWHPDKVFTLIKAGLLQGKSIGFVALKKHAPSSHEIAARPELADVRCIIDEWMLLEYACVFLPANQSALVEAVSKGSVEIPASLLAQLRLPIADLPKDHQQSSILPMTPLAEIEKAIERRLKSTDYQGWVRRAVDEAVDRARGRV
jgi:hypothetical protein